MQSEYGKTIGVYHDLFLKMDVTLLVDVFQTITYKLDLLRYYTALGLS